MPSPINTNVGLNGGQRLAAGQYNDAGTGVSNVNSNFNSSSGVKDTNWWNSHYGSNYVKSSLGSINASTEEYDLGTAQANAQVATTYIENGVIYQVVTNEDGTTQTIQLGNTSDLNGLQIDPSQIDWSQISSTANGALNGNFFDPSNVDSQYWGNNGAVLFIQVMENGAILILENGVPMGWTTLSGINIDVKDELTLEFGEYRKNADGSITYVNARGETISIDSSDIFIDENGMQFFVSEIDENGNVVGAISLNDDGTLSGYTSKNGNNLGDLLSLDAGEYFRSSGGDIIYNNGSSFKVVDSGKMIDINGETYFISKTDSEGNITGLIKVDERVEGIIGDSLNSVLSNLANDYDAITSSDGSIIYKIGEEYRVINSEDMFEINGNQYLVTRVNDNGDIIGALSFDSESGKMVGYNGEDASNIFSIMGDATYLETSNGDIVYKDYEGGIKIIDSSEVSIDDEGNKYWEGHGGINIVFEEDGTVSTEINQDTHNASSTGNMGIKDEDYWNSHYGKDFVDFYNETNSSNQSMNIPSSSSTSMDKVIDLGNGFSQTKLSENIDAFYGPSDQLIGLNIDGNEYRFDEDKKQFILHSDGYTITYNQDGTFERLTGNNLFVTQNEQGQLHNLSASNTYVPSNVAALCTNMNLNGTNINFNL